MRRVMWLLFAALSSAMLGLGAHGELRLAEFTAGTNTFTNVVITASSGGRVLVEYPRGMASLRVADLELEQQEQLLQAGLVTGPIAAQIEQAIAKREAAKRKAELKAAREARGPMEAPEISLETAQQESIARLLATQTQYLVESNDLEWDWEALLGRFGARIVYGLLGVVGFLSLFRRYLFFRICRNATSEGSFFVFIPVVRWFVLVGAANMSRHWLLVPMFAVAALFLPPDAVDQYPWAAMGWLVLIGVLWFITAILYIVWCVRLCRAVDCSGWLAVLLMLPVVDYIALLVLAFGGTKADSTPVAAPMKKPVLAI